MTWQFLKVQQKQIGSQSRFLLSGRYRQLHRGDIVVPLGGTDANSHKEAVSIGAADTDSHTEVILPVIPSGVADQAVTHGVT